MLDEYSITSICLMILFVSFMGFVTENIWLSFTKGYMDNRNMSLPFLLGYGLMMMTVYSIMGIPKDTTHYFIMAGIMVMAGEVSLGYLVEKTCHFEWWNYSWIPLHITKYTSIPTTIIFAFIITGFMGHMFVPLMDYFETLESRLLNLVAPAMVGILLVDMVRSFHRMYRTRGLFVTWKIQVRKEDHLLRIFQH